MSMTLSAAMNQPTVFSLMSPQYRVNCRVLLDFLNKDETYQARLEHTLNYLRSKSSGFIDSVGESTLKVVLGCGYLVDEFIKSSQELLRGNVIWLDEINGFIEVINYYRCIFTELTNYRRVMYKGNPLIRNVISFSERHITRRLEKKKYGNDFYETQTLHTLWDKDAPSTIGSVLAKVSKGFSWFSRFLFNNIRSIGNETYKIVSRSQDILRDIRNLVDNDKENKYAEIKQLAAVLDESLLKVLGASGAKYLHCFSVMATPFDLLQVEINSEFTSIVIDLMGRRASYAQGEFQNLDMYLGLLKEHGFNVDNLNQSWRNALSYSYGNFR